MSQLLQNADDLAKSEGTGMRRSQLTQLKVDALRSKMAGVPKARGHRNRNYPQILTGSLDGAAADKASND